MESSPSEINWDLLQYAAGGSSRGVLESTGAGEAYGLLADLECLSAEERLERLAQDVQAILSADPDFVSGGATQEEERCRDVVNLQLDTTRNEMRGVPRTDDRGRDGGSRGVSEVRTDSSKTDLRTGRKGTLFFETVFGCNDCHLDSCEYCGHDSYFCTDRWCHTCFFFKNR